MLHPYMAVRADLREPLVLDNAYREVGTMLTQDQFDDWCEAVGTRWHRVENATTAERAAAAIWLQGQEP